MSLLTKGKQEAGWKSRNYAATLTGKQPKPKQKSIKRTIAIAYQILPSAGLNKELNAGQHITIADCVVDYSEIKKTKN